MLTLLILKAKSEISNLLSQAALTLKRAQRKSFGSAKMKY